MNKEEHLLSCLAEEAGEIVQAVGKALRFGLDDGYPGTDRTNEGDIQIELLQLIAVMEMLEDEGFITQRDLVKSRGVKIAKKAKVIEYMKHAKNTGALKG